MENVKAVIFDIDGTLYDFWGTDSIAMKKVSDYTNENFGIWYNDYNKECMKAVEARTGANCSALHNRLLRFEYFVVNFAKVNDYKAAHEMYEIYWGTMMKEMKPYPMVVRLIDALKSKGIKVGVGTDMTVYMQYNKLIALGVLEKLDFIVTSEEASAEKPDPKFFDMCVTKSGIEPKDAIFIGDNPKKDVGGAIDYGYYGIWYNDAHLDNPNRYPEIYDYASCFLEDGNIKLGKKVSS